MNGLPDFEEMLKAFSKTENPLKRKAWRQYACAILISKREVTLEHVAKLADEMIALESKRFGEGTHGNHG